MRKKKGGPQGCLVSPRDPPYLSCDWMASEADGYSSPDGVPSSMVSDRTN